MSIGHSGRERFWVIGVAKPPLSTLAKRMTETAVCGRSMAKSVMSASASIKDRSTMVLAGVERLVSSENQ